MRRRELFDMMHTHKNNRIMFQGAANPQQLALRQKRGIRYCFREPNSLYDGANGVHDLS